MTPAVTSLRSHHRHEHLRIKKEECARVLGRVAMCWLPVLVARGLRRLQVRAAEDKPEFSSWESLPVNVSATSVARMPTREQARVGNEGSA